MTQVDPVSVTAIPVGTELRRADDGSIEQWTRVLVVQDDTLAKEREGLKALLGMDPDSMRRLSAAIQVSTQKQITVDQALQLQIAQVDQLLDNAPPPTKTPPVVVPVSEVQ